VVNPSLPRSHLLAAAKKLRGGGAIAHVTSTLPGIAALPDTAGMMRVQRLKGRRGPFILLAADRKSAERLLRYRSPLLRHAMRHYWPGDATLIVPARPGLPKALYRKGAIAVRVDGDAATRRLCRLCGGLLLSSSLNRRGKPTCRPSRRLRWRWQRYLDGWLPGRGSGKASRILRLRTGRWQQLR